MQSGAGRYFRYAFPTLSAPVIVPSRIVRDIYNASRLFSFCKSDALAVRGGGTVGIDDVVDSASESAHTTLRSPSSTHPQQHTLRRMRVFECTCG